MCLGLFFPRFSKWRRLRSANADADDGLRLVRKKSWEEEERRRHRVGAKKKQKKIGSLGQKNLPRTGSQTKCGKKKKERKKAERRNFKDAFLIKVDAPELAALMSRLDKLPLRLRSAAPSKGSLVNRFHAITTASFRCVANKKIKKRR